MTLIYLDSSAIVKRYILEPGTDEIKEIYHKALNGDVNLSFSVWNIGEVLGVFDKYYRRKWISKQDHKIARQQFIGETLRLLKLRLLKLVPVKTRLLMETWILIERYHLYEADALQIVSSKYVGADKLYTGDKQVYNVAIKEGINAVYVGLEE